MIPIHDDPVRRSFPIVTWTFIVLNVLVFLYELSLGGRLDQFVSAFGTTPLSAADWLICIVLASLVLWGDELRKLLLRRIPNQEGR